jgi:hypothetical protein
MAISARRGFLWTAEVVVTAIKTLSFFPMLLLYVLDLATGLVSPGAGWAFAVVIGMLGVWAALLIPDSRYQRNPRMRWAVVAALAIATIIVGRFLWNSVRAFGFGLLLFANVAADVAAAVVALHQLVRLILLRPATGAAAFYDAPAVKPSDRS